MRNMNHQKLQNILLYILLGLLAFLLAGTIIIFQIKGPATAQKYRKADPAPSKVVNLSSRRSDKLDAFTDISQIRTVTKSADGKTSGTTIIISPWFAYPAGDKTFLEELSQKERMERTIIAEYFTHYTEIELRQKGEKKIKEELLELLNQNLVLGQINALYFNDYMFIQ